MRLTCPLVLLGSTTLAVAVHGQTLISTMNGPTVSHFGAAVISAGFQDADTYADLLVGAPNEGFGTIHCISGRFLATGQGPSELWSLSSPTIANSAFGASLAAVGNLTGNSTADFVVGAPGYRVNPFSGINNGALFLVDGSTHTIAATIYGSDNTALGRVVVSVSDQNGDGKHEVAATGPALITSNPSKVYVIQGSTFVGTKSITAAAHSSLNSNGANEFGETIASGFDLDGNGKRDLAIGSPRMLGNGLVSVVSADNQFTTLASYVGSGGGERMGSSISASHDYNGDGVVDFVVGAPEWSTNHATNDGRAVVLSGLNLRTFTLPYELATFALTAGGVASYRFGDAVRASPDLNRDGVGDFLIGAPSYFTSFPSGPAKGAVYVYSGATLTRIATLFGASNDRLGDVILGALQDVTGDFVPEFVVAGSGSDNPALDCGVIKLYELFPSPASTYCAAKLNSLGCWPSIGFTGSASASSGLPFLVTCSSLINQKSGILFYSHLPNAAPFQGGFLCVKPPTRRIPQASSGGSASGADCTGTYSFDFNARIASGVDATLVTGAEVFCQYQSRDQQSPSGTSLSNALRFVINP